MNENQDKSNIVEKAITSQHLRSIVDNMCNMIGYWDKNLRCCYANKAYSEWFDKLPQDLIGISLSELLGEHLFSLNKSYILGVLDGKPQRFQRALENINGGISHVIGHYIPDFNEHGVVRGFAVQACEVTDLKETEEELKLAACVFENTADGVLITDVNGVILSVNPAFIEITGYAAEDVIGKNPRILKSNRHDEAFYNAMWKEIKTEGCWNGKIWNRRKDGKLYLERMTIRAVNNANGKPIRYVSVFNDITERWNKGKYVKHLAFHDALTDLPNRNLLIEQLEQNIITAKLQQYDIALMFLDLDGFKVINDRFGHNIGDEVLKEVANRLQALVRTSDIVARVGGDEFIFILNNENLKDEIMQVANRLVRSVNGSMNIHGEVFKIGISVGIAIYPSDGQTSADLIDNADSAMYKSKDAGTNNIHFFSS